MNGPSKRASLHTLGCRLNQSETNIIRGKLEAAGYEIVPFGEVADFGVINTCTVTREADAKSRKAVRSFIRKNPDAFVAVIGCYSQMDAAAIAEIQGVDLIVGNQEKLNVLDYAVQGKNSTPLIVRDRIERDDFTIETNGLGSPSCRANLKIQDGCDFMCSFCVIPFARGRARSRRIGNLLDEARQLVKNGAKELVLTGVNIGTYAFEDYTLLDVIDRLNEIEGMARIRISSIEPTTIPMGLLERMADPAHALVPHLHIPLQSGSDRVLERMRRRYTRAEFLNFVETAAARVPDTGIGTDIMAGMPGESDADFEDTCALLTDGPIDYTHVFKFSEREGTAAARMSDRIHPGTVDRRAARVRQISAEKLRAFHARHAGHTHEVLFEQREGEYWTGYTENYIRVAVRSDDILENQICPVVIEESKGEFVLAELAGEFAVAS